MSSPKNHKNKILYIFHYGDQHDNKGVNTVSDGGSNIHTHLIKELSRTCQIKISTYQDNYLIQNIFSKNESVKVQEHFTISGLFKRNLLFYEILLRCLYPGLLFLLRKSNFDYLVTETDFIPDVIIALFIKIRNPKIIWIASYFLDAPKPWDKNSPYKGRRWFVGLFYWLLQRPSYWIIKFQADFVLVTSKPDVLKFITKKRKPEKVIVARGGVDTEDSEEYLKSDNPSPIEKRKYDACFVGRFHYQKGVLELIDIWREVCAIVPNARLAMIGFGPLENDVRMKIAKYKLGRNIDLLGYKTGKDKYEIFKKSKIIVHPATYDSGGMAAAEAMAWGLPGISFNLESLRSYYPKGVVKVRCYNIKEFAVKIVGILQDRKLYKRLSREAHELIINEWSWRNQPKKIIGMIIRT